MHLSQPAPAAFSTCVAFKSVKMGRGYNSIYEPYMNHTYKGTKIVSFRLLGHEEMEGVVKDRSYHSQQLLAVMIRRSQEPQVPPTPRAVHGAQWKIQPHKGSKPQGTTTEEERKASWDRANLRTKLTTNKNVSIMPQLPPVPKTGKAKMKQKSKPKE